MVPGGRFDALRANAGLRTRDVVRCVCDSIAGRQRVSPYQRHARVARAPHMIRWSCLVWVEVFPLFSLRLADTTHRLVSATAVGVCECFRPTFTLANRE
jgi:hypothetical protein